MPMLNQLGKHEVDLSKQESKRATKELNIETFRSDEPIPAYCIYEKKGSMLKNPKPFRLKNGLPAIEGTCVSCNRKISRIGTLE